jgi:predicted outer membrane repeat protein
MSAQRGVCGIETGGLIVDQVWSRDDSPVVVTADLSVASLTIMPGVVVDFAGNYQVTVNGIIRAVGTSEFPVVLKPAEDNTEGWQGIHFENTTPGSEFEWCHIEGAQNSAVHLVRSHPTFRNCTFAANGSDDSGGAIHAELVDGDLTIADCDFLGNSAEISGGAIWASLETGTLFVTDCNFTDNVANPDPVKRNTPAGAVLVRGNSRFIRSTFTGNQVHAYTIVARFGVYTKGGAMWTEQGHCEITACTFLDNACSMTAHRFTPDISYAYGGAVYLESGSMTLQNSLLARNTLSAENRRSYKGSALFVNTGDCSIVNCTFADNTSAEAIHNDAGTVSLMNSILYLNGDHVTQISGPAMASYSDIQGGFDGENIIDFNPVFDLDYRILPGSPAIDTGNPDPEYNDTHFPPSLGTERNDMGSLGGPSASSWLEAPDQPPKEVLEVELGTFVRWPDRTGVYLEWAVDVNGPWQPYDGDLLTVGTSKVALVEESEPRHFFRLVKK